MTLPFYNVRFMMIKQTAIFNLRPVLPCRHPSIALWGIVSFLTLAAAWRLAAQPQACRPGTLATNFCDSACVNCNFSGTGGTTVAWGGSVPTACGLLQNPRWTGFVASYQTATFRATPASCGAGKGLKLALYANCDSLPIACNSGTGSLEPVVLANMPLVIGRHYYLVVAGYDADVCDFSVSCVPPMIPATPNTIQAIVGPSKICPKKSAVYSIQPVPLRGAESIVWFAPPGSTINGQTSPVTIDVNKGGTSVTVTFGNISGEIRALGKNPCRTGVYTAHDVTVTSIPPTYQLPRRTVCRDSFLPGNWPLDTVYVTAEGCDSLVVRSPLILPTYAISPIIRYACADNPTFKICDSVFAAPNPNIVRTCKTFLGCDSTVTVDLRLLNPVAKVIRTSGNNLVLCANAPLILRSLPSPSPNLKTWRNMAGTVLGKGDTLKVEQAGQYILESKTTIQGTTCIKRDTVQVDLAPSPVQAASTVSPTCVWQKTGTVAINASSGAPPYTYTWSNNRTGAVLNKVGQGTYTVTVKDGNGCTAQLSATVPAIPVFGVQLQTLPESTGNACQSTAIPSLGTPPYSFRWSNGQTGAVATQLSQGPFNVLVKDATGCTSFRTGSCSLINTRAVGEAVSITPNPANTHIALYAHLPFSERWQVSLISPIGQTLFEQTYTGDTVEDRIDVRDFPEGCYLLRLATSSGYWHAERVAVVR